MKLFLILWGFVCLFSAGLFADCSSCPKGLATKSLLNRFSKSLNDKSENIVFVKRLTSKEVRDLGLWNGFDASIGNSGNVIFFFEVLDSTRMSSKYVSLAVPIGMSRLRGDNRGMPFYAQEGEEWILITKGKHKSSDRIARIELIDRVNGVLKVADNWINVDGRKFFDDLKILSNSFSAGGPLDKTKLQTGLGELLIEKKKEAGAGNNEG